MGVNQARNAYLNEIMRYVCEGQDIILVSADLAAPSLDQFRRNYPQRYVSVGIAEQNLISVACGIAMTGKIVIAYAANPFTITRAYDQIRNAVSMMNIPISIVGVGSGFNLPEFGATHYTTEDIGLMRLCPNINIINISDIVMARKAAEYSIYSKKPLYIRLDRLTNDSIYNIENINFDKGFERIHNGSGTLIAATGVMSFELYQRCREKKDLIKPKVLDVFSFPFDQKKFVSEAEGVNKIITLEECSYNGGLGSAIIECINDYGVPITVERYGIDFKDGFPEDFGSRKYFTDRYKLNIDDVLQMCY